VCSLCLAEKIPNTEIAQPSKLSKRLNILGFIQKNNSFFYPHEGNVTTKTVINAFGQHYAQTYTQTYTQTKIPCIVILDNAPVQTSAAFLEKSEDWYSYGLMLHFLPTYSPELNLIEILWRKMKYEWISFNAYTSYMDSWIQLINAIPALMRLCGKSFQKTPRKAFCN
jgi:transposase